MLSFRPLELADLPAVRPFFEQSRSRLCDWSTTMFLWRKYFATQFSLGNDALYIKQLYDGIPTFMTPAGGDFHAGIQTLLAYCRAHGHRALFSVVAQDEMAALRERYPLVSAEPMRDWFDYLYECQDLAAFPGKRYHGQRNHVSRFDREYPNHRFSPLNDLTAARDFIDRFYQTHPPQNAAGQAERESIYELLEHGESYGLLGGVLTVDDTIASLSVGEVVGDTLFVHIEKADAAYHGVYPKTVSLFARAYGANIRYVNREEDMGLPGLRTSKQSYHPAALLEKYMVEIAL